MLTTTKNKNLLLFNLKTDADDDILGFTTDWINALAPNFNHVFVITMCAGRIEVAENVQVFSVGKEKGYSEPRRAFEFYRILWKILRSKKIDACFAHMMPLFAVMAGPFLRLKQIPMLLWYAHKSVTLTLRLATFFVNRVVASSKEGFRLPTKKLHVIGQGIDTNKFVPAEKSSSSHDPFTILTIGRLSPIKRIELLIEAVALFQKRKPDVPIRLCIVGGPLTQQDITYTNELKQLTNKSDLEQIVAFVGSIPFRKVAHYYQQADCFVNLAETGSLDKTVLEAMSSGIVVVVNRTFEKVLGAELAKTYVIDWDAEQLCDRLILLATLSLPEKKQLAEQLREIVLQDHSLNGLCGKLLSQFQDL